MPAAFRGPSLLLPILRAVLLASLPLPAPFSSFASPGFSLPSLPARCVTASSGVVCRLSYFHVASLSSLSLRRSSRGSLAFPSFSSFSLSVIPFFEPPGASALPRFCESLPRLSYFCSRFPLCWVTRFVLLELSDARWACCRARCPFSSRLRAWCVGGLLVFFLFAPVRCTPGLCLLAKRSLPFASLFLLVVCLTLPPFSPFCSVLPFVGTSFFFPLHHFCCLSCLSPRPLPFSLFGFFFTASPPCQLGFIPWG